MDDMVARPDTGTRDGAHRHAAHPLDSLTADEISAVTRAVRAHPEFGEDAMFETMEVKEPAKSVVRAFRPGDPIERLARVSVFRSGGIGVWRLVVSVADEEVVEIEHLPQARPMIQLEEFMVIEDMVKTN
ncbi:MAG: hypothetical protein ACR2PM_11060, partial [Hyphomicrobiales bacterium]